MVGAYSAFAMLSCLDCYTGQGARVSGVRSGERPVVVRLDQHGCVDLPGKIFRRLGARK